MCPFIITVLGTLAGDTLTYLFQAGLASQTCATALAERRRGELIDADSALGAAKLAYRHSQLARQHEFVRTHQRSEAALAAWGFGKRKQTWSELQANFAFLTADEHLFPHFASDDVCAAVVCALVARARHLELTIGPPADAFAAGRREGWIHVSCEPSGLLAETG